MKKRINCIIAILFLVIFFMMQDTVAQTTQTCDYSTSSPSSGNINGSITVTYPSSAGSIELRQGFGNIGPLIQTVTVTGPGSTTFTGLPSGDYHFKVWTTNHTNMQSSTCSKNVSIAQPVPVCNLTATAISGNIMCNGGTTTIMVSATGGTPPYIGTGNFNVYAGTYTYNVTDANNCQTTVTITVEEPALLTASSTGGTIQCFGNSTIVTVTATGGTEPYYGTGNYNAYPGIQTYYIIDNNGCLATTNVAVEGPSQLTAASSAGDILCSGGTTTITVSAGGGTCPYSGTGDFVVHAGTYNYFIADNNGCTALTTITVNEPPYCYVSATAGNILCNGGSTTVNVTAWGGTQPYDGTGNFIVTAGIHFFTIYDALGCHAVTSLTITEPPVLSASNVPGNIICNGGTAPVAVIASGGTYPYSGTGVYYTNAGTHNYLVTDVNGCTATTSVSLSEPPQMSATVNSNNQEIYYGYSPFSSAAFTATVSGGAAPYSVSWNPGQIITASMSNIGNPTVTATITDANGCQVTASKQVSVVDVRCGNNNNKVLVCHNGNLICVSENAVSTHLSHGDHLGYCPDKDFSIENNDDNQSDLHVYPNPFSGSTTFILSSKTEGKYSIDIYNTNGQLVSNIFDEYVQDGVNQQLDINFTGNSAGMYLVKVTGPSGIQLHKILFQP
jgi:hypothetical protein